MNAITISRIFAFFSFFVYLRANYIGIIQKQKTKQNESNSKHTDFRHKI